MERYIQSPNKKLWHIFEDRYAVEFTEDGLKIIHDLSFHDDEAKHGCPEQMPCHIITNMLPATRVRDCLHDFNHIELPIAIELKGANLGAASGATISQYEEKGLRDRTLDRVKCLVAVVDGDLLLDIEIGASPVNPEQIVGELADWEQKPANYRFQPRIPAAYVAEFLNMTEQQKRQYALRRMGNENA
jgi:hypothetical protein